ncbi:MAG: hypothetical protein KFF73_08030 [Cyclobacteriaceae bacterium]|nr:hypothetical protein [Cyclobacteriaceae bacterium]
MLFFAKLKQDMTISSRRIRKIYSSLDKDQIKLVIDKKIEGKLEIQQWLEKLHKLAVMDTLGDDSRKKSGELSIIFGLITAFTIILTISKPFMFFFPVGFFLLFFYFLIMYITLNKIDIGNNLRFFIVPLLEHFKEENRIDGPVFLNMDFSNPKNRKNIIHQTVDPERQRKLFQHHWMQGEMMFTDQVMISWKIVDTVTDYGKNLQEKAGNRDLKKKNLVTHQLDLVFHVPKKRFDIEKPGPEVKDAGNYYEMNLNRSDTSDSLEVGMMPETFLEAVREGYHYIRKKEVSI